ncbi:CDC27 family protein [Hydrogenimonas sp.]
MKPQPAIPEKLATETEPQSEPSGKLVISTKQTNNTLQYLIDKFNQTRDPKLATYIANSYYKKGAYKETIRWAIMANSLDPASEESWLLFAKAKTKLGQREDAISALKIYLNQYPSKRVKAYLQSLETGL